MRVPTRKIIAGHLEFRESFSSNPVLRKLAEEGQHPKVLWIGCSDSRVIPELITGAEPGELFDVRNIANVVPPAGAAACATGAAVEYAVMHLKVHHAVVCGHTECGGIKGLEDDPDPERQPHITAWLELARPAREQVLSREVDEAERYLETIKTNVLNQCENLRTYPCVAERERSGELSIHGWLYDLSIGRIFAYDDASQGWQPVGAPPPSP
jgi:carbonic anhydrase